MELTRLCRFTVRTLAVAMFAVIALSGTSHTVPGATATDVAESTLRTGNSAPNVIQGTVRDQLLGAALGPAEADTICCIIPGDANGSGSTNISDAVFLISLIFSGGSVPPCLGQGDANGNCEIGIGDINYLISAIFGGGPSAVCGSCDSIIVGGTLNDPGDSLIIRPNGDLVCDISNPIPIIAHTATDIDAISIALEVTYPSALSNVGGRAATLTIDSLTPVSAQGFQFPSGLNVISDGFSPDTITFGGAGANPDIPAQSGDTLYILWVTPSNSGPFQFNEVNNITTKTRYVSPGNPVDEFILPLKTGVIFADCGGALSVNPDPKMLICPGGDEAFRVKVIDEFDNPVVGNNSVWIELVNCGGLYSCSNGPGIDTLFPVAPSNDSGFLTFLPEGGGCDAVCMADIKIGNNIKASVPVMTFDVNSDTLVSVGDFQWDPVCNDYGGNPGIDIADFNIFNKHLGHHCDLDPCERFSATFSVTPGANLVPGQVVTLEVEIFNNSFDVCFVGPIGFFNSGFGSGETDILFDNVNFNDTIHPGEMASSSVEFTIPGSGAGCFSTRFLTQTPCCDTAITLRHCAISTQHCTQDENFCFERRISLSKFPVDQIQIIDSFLPGPGWQVIQINVPQTPLNMPDTIIFEICTPVQAALGDSAVVPVYVYSQGNPNPELFEAEVFVTSRTGDVNGDCRVNIADITYMIARIFAGGPDAKPPQAGDPNCSGSLNIADITFLIARIFANGKEPCIM